MSGSTTFMICLLCVLVLAALVPASVTAHSESENAGFVDMVISFMNNQKECQLPTYSEIDELQRRLGELEIQRGGTLTEDQKLVKATILDQWDSFQAYLKPGNVLKSAKKRAFLGKIEKYQEAKFGESVCTKQPDTSILDNKEYEKNPLVRYVKMSGSQSKEASEPSADSSDGGTSGGDQRAAQHEQTNSGAPDVELKFKVHTRDDKGRITSSRQIAGKFNFDESRAQNRITLHLGPTRR